MVNGRFLSNPSYRCLKKFNILTLCTNNVTYEWRWRCRLHDHGGLSSSQGHNERPSWTVEHNHSRSNGNEYRLKPGERNRNSVFEILTFCLAKFDTSCGLPCCVYSLPKSLMCWLSVRGTKFEISREHASKRGWHLKTTSRQSCYGSLKAVCKWAEWRFLTFVHRRSLASSRRAFFYFFRALFSALRAD